MPEQPQAADATIGIDIKTHVAHGASVDNLLLEQMHTIGAELDGGQNFHPV